MHPSQISAVAEEVQRTLQGECVAEVIATETDAVVLEFRRDRPRLLLSCHPKMCRVHLASSSPQGTRPHPFRDLLDARLAGTRLAAVEQPGGERVLRLFFGGEQSEGHSLVAELFGRRPNLVLLDRSGTVLGAWRTFPGGARPIVAGAPYVPLAPPTETPPEAGPPRTSAEWERDFAEKERVELLAVLRGGAEDGLGKELYRIDGVLRGLRAGLDASARCEQVRLEGELLKTNLDRVPRGATGVDLPNLFDPSGGAVHVDLDPRMGPRENLERLFRRYRRLRDARTDLQTRIAAFEGRRARAQEALDLAERSDDPSELARIAGENAPRAGRAKAGRRAPAKEKTHRAFMSCEGIPIWVGRGGRENDRLTFRLARGNDYWLHAKDCPGSHVVVRTGKRELGQETLLDAAHLALYYSKARGRSSGEVTYTQAKFVRKPRGAGPGQVALGDSRTLLVRWEERRMARLAAEAPDAREDP